MIKRLELKNFQSHKHTILDFVPGVNVIVGLSDSGKSAIMNSIGWVFENQPQGDSFRSWWGGDTEVHMDLDNGQIARIRGDKFNGYVLGMHDTFVALKGEVPKEIKEFLNVNEVNFQRQLDRHYLLSNTPGEVAKHFNKIAKLDKIDLSTSNINSWISQINQDIKYKESDLEKNLEKLEVFNHLEKLEAEVEVLEEMENKARTLDRNLRKCEKLINQITSIDAKIDAKETIIQMGPEVTALLEQIEEKKVLESQYGKLSKLIKRIDDISEVIIDKERIILAEDLINDLLLMYKDGSELKKEISRIAYFVSTGEKLEKKLANAIVNHDMLSEELTESMPDVCPFCNQTIKHKHNG
jgi:exonuclease SbcC